MDHNKFVDNNHYCFSCHKAKESKQLLPVKQRIKDVNITVTFTNRSRVCKTCERMFYSKLNPRRSPHKKIKMKTELEKLLEDEPHSEEILPVPRVTRARATTKSTSLLHDHLINDEILPVPRVTRARATTKSTSLLHGLMRQRFTDGLSSLDNLTTPPSDSGSPPSNERLSPPISERGSPSPSKHGSRPNSNRGSPSPSDLTSPYEASKNTDEQFITLAARPSATMVKTKKLILNKLFDGEPKLTDFTLVEEELPALKDGEYLCEALFLSVDPYMRAFDVRETVGKPMLGSSVAKVLESRNKDFNVGDVVFGYFGWQTHFIQTSEEKNLLDVKPYVVSGLGDLSPSLALGVLGMPGNTAYFGFLELCQPKEGETVVVNAAAGAVGMHVGQIAKIKGCRVIGFAGSDEKVEWLKKEIGFDHAFNYKTIDVTDALKQAAPNGVDCYFDNVGGEMSSKILAQMNNFGRISVCGSISAYNASPDNPPLAPFIQGHMIFKNLKMEGFIVYRWQDRWMEGVEQNLKWIQEGKLKFKETITEGFENMPQAFISLMKGGNVGKAVVKA